MNTEIGIKFAKRLKKLRKKHNLTQERLAELGASPQSLTSFS